MRPLISKKRLLNLYAGNHIFLVHTAKIFYCIIWVDLLALILVSCQKDDSFHPNSIPHINKPPMDFIIIAEEITGNSIMISFTESLDQNYKKVKYKFTLNGNLITENQTYAGIFKFEHLQSETLYTIKVTAVDNNGMINNQTIRIKTLNNGATIRHTTNEFKGRVREYGLYLPTGYQYEKMPLVIFLHGAAGVVWPKMIDYYFCELAQREKFAFLQPQGLLTNSSVTGITHWDAHNSMPWNDVAFINSLIDTLDKKGLIDTNRIYVSGMSNGGFMTYTIAEKLQDRIAAIAPIAGLMDNVVFNGYDMRKPMPICNIHGTADATVPLEGDQYSVGWSTICSFWLNNNSASLNPVITELPDINKIDNSTVSKFEYSSYLGKGDVTFYRINNGGHSIPGLEYPANMDINAFEEIWKFFEGRELQKTNRGD